MVKNNFKYLKITMPLILLLTMIAIFFYYNAQENIRGFYKTRGFQGKVQITGIGWADKITYRMNKEDEVKHYLMKENMGTTLLKSLLKSTLEIKNLSMISLKL